VWALDFQFDEITDRRRLNDAPASVLVTMTPQIDALVRAP